LLNDITSKQDKLFDTSSKLNMIIIWASWCGPCIQEIPALKQLNEIYASKGLSMTTVSIDDAINLWREALQQEKMS